MFDQDLLRTFVAIVDTGSFSAAAKAVGRTSSAVSMQIQRLEDAVGRRLLVRGAHGVQLTGDGETLLVHAREILQASAAAYDAMMAGRSALTLTVGLPDTYVITVLAPLLSGLVRNFPDTNLRILVEGSRTLVRKLEEAAVDLAFVTEYQLGGDDRGDLIHVERSVWACAEACSALAEPALPVALIFEGSVYRRLAQEMLRQVSRPYRVALSTNAESVVQAAILSGAVIAPLPASRLLPGMRELNVKEGFPEIPPLRVRMRVGRRKLSPAGEWLAAQLRDRGSRLAAEASP